MSRNWDALITFEDWAKVLHELLGEARKAIHSGNIEKRVAVQEELSAFIMTSPNTLAAELDEIARKAITDIFKTTVDEALASLANRTAELATHIKVVNAVTLEAEQAARSIRLENATKVISSATAILRDLHELRQALTATKEDTLLAGKIDKTVKALQELIPLVMTIKST